eukprot:1584860-Prymnesium_polylepis.1
MQRSYPVVPHVNARTSRSVPLLGAPGVMARCCTRRNDGMVSMRKYKGTPGSAGAFMTAHRSQQQN